MAEKVFREKSRRREKHPSGAGKAGVMIPRATIYESFSDIPDNDWNQVIGHCDRLPMDLRLLEAFQRTMISQCKCWAVLFRDDSGQPIAAACLCLFRVDGMDTTRPMALRLVRLVRRFWPGFLKFNVLFCGLPVPSGASHIRFGE